MITKRNSFNILLLIAALAAAPAFAVDDTWDGDTDANFYTAANWVGNQVPGNTSAGTTLTPDIATFSGTSNTTVNVDSGRTLARLIIGASSGPFVFNGGPLYFFSNGTTGNRSIYFDINATTSATFNTDIFGANHTTAANRNLYFSSQAGSANHTLGVMFNINGNLTPGLSGTSGGSVNFAVTTTGGSAPVAVVRGVIGNPSGTANTSVSQDYSGSLIWYKAQNTYRGSFGMSRGLAIFETVTPVGGGASGLGNAATTALGNISVGSTSAEQTLFYAGTDAAGHSTDRNIIYGNVSPAILAAHGVGPLTWSGDVRHGSSTNNYNLVFSLAGSSIAENVFAGAVTNNGTNIFALRKRGEGTWNVTAAQPYTGITELRAGLLRLDFAGAGAPTSNIVNSVSPLYLYDGVLAVRGKDGAANTQTFNGTNLREGYTSIEVAPGAGGTVAVNLGALSRASTVNTTNTGHVLNITNPSGATVTTSHTETTNGVLTINATAFATANKTDWATLSGSNIVALSTYQTSTDPTAWAASDNVSLSGNPDSNPGTQTINTLRLTGSSAITLGGNLTIGASGILITGAGVNSFTGGNLIGGGNQTAQELIIVQNNTANPVTMSTTLRNGTGTTTHLTKAGPGTLFLTGNNNFTGRYGETTIADGVLAVSTMNALGSSTLKFAGGQLGLAGSDLTFTIATGAVGRFQVVGSFGFAAYNADRTVTINSTLDLSGLRNGEFLLSAADADGKITVNSTNSSIINLASASGSPNVATIRVFDGAAAVDAEIAMVMSVLHNSTATGMGGFQKMGAGVLQLSGTNLYNGPTIVSEGGLIVTGSIANSMLTEVRDGAWLGGNGTTASIQLNAGGRLAPGLSIGTLSTQNNGNGYFMWNGETTDTAQMLFELSTTDNTSDRLNLGTSEFLKGTGSYFKFNFMGGGKLNETYTLVQFGSTTFASDASDFTYENLASGLSGSFSMDSNNLLFTVIPEPGTAGLLLGGLALAALRRRIRR